MSNIASADTLNEIHLNQNDKAPFSGSLFTDDKTQDIYKTYQDLDLEKALNQSQTNQINLLNSNNNLLTQSNGLLLDQNNKLMQANKSEQTLNDVEKIGCFLLGVVVTGLAVKGAASLKP